MRLNYNVKLIGKGVVLVPYEAAHVPKYHNWMEDQELRRLTGSERLTLDEEYAMQRSWREDDDKLTFIILSKETLDGGSSEESSMVGDVNLFIDRQGLTAEAEVMVAESAARGRGVAEESLRLILSYAVQQLQIVTFFVKITDDNAVSLHLFQKKLGFKIVSHSTAFKEYTLELPDISSISGYLTDAQVASYR